MSVPTERVISNIKSLKIHAGLFIYKHEGKLSDHYIIGNKLGSGSYGYVREAVSISTQQRRAIKSIKKKHISSEDKEKSKFFAEVDILSKIDHPNIVKLYEFYEDELYYHLVTEFVKGGQLLEYIVNRKIISESIAANFMKQLLSGITYCHAMHIVHRDIKPENLLLDSDSPDAILKIIDFGTSHIFTPNFQMTKRLGTVYYVAPEVLQRKYDEKCDIWSCGVILFILLSGRPPFAGKNEAEVMENIMCTSIELTGTHWENVSSSAKNLVLKMLERDPLDRISAKAALTHEWIQNAGKVLDVAAPENIEHAVFSNLQHFHAARKLEQAVLTFMASQLVVKELSEKSIRIFKSIDKNNDGMLSREELLSAFTKEMPDFSQEEIENFMQQADVNNSGFIDFTEFVMASTYSELLMSNNILQDAFNAFDIDKNGSISAEELKQVLGSGLRSQDDLWKNLIKEVDKNGDGAIDMEEFVAMMQSINK